MATSWTFIGQDGAGQAVFLCSDCAAEPGRELAKVLVGDEERARATNR